MRSRLLLVAALLAWAVWPTAVHRAPARDLSPRVVVEDGLPPQPSWDPSPHIATARFEAGDGTVSAVVEVRPPTPVVGEEVLVHVSATDLDGRELYAAAHFGTSNRRGEIHTILECQGKAGSPSPTTVQPSHTAFTQAYVFHAAGSHPLAGSAKAVGCGPDASLAVTGTIEVRAGTTAGNLRHEPTATIEAGDQPVGANYGRDVSVRITDLDGFVDSATFDMGDGSPPRPAAGDRDPFCREAPARLVGHGETSTGLNHYFPGPGTYLVRVTATTAACDGTNPQTVTATRSLTLPPFRY